MSTAANGNKSDDIANKQQPRFECIAQGLRDLSFETKMVPAFFEGSQPDLSLDVSVSFRSVNDEEGVYDVALAMRGQSADAEKTFFLVELLYAGIFRLQGIEAPRREALLRVAAPSMLYPFARQIFMTAIGDSGFKAPVLDPINFEALYLQAKQQEGQEA